MTEPLDVLIQAAFCTRLTSPAWSPVVPIAMPLVAFVPPTSGGYIDVRPILRATPEHFGLLATNSNLFRGIFQVDAVTPDNQGEAPGLRLAALIAARFSLGMELVAGMYRVQLLEVPAIAAAIKDVSWIRFPVSIPYLVIT